MMFYLLETKHIALNSDFCMPSLPNLLFRLPVEQPLMAFDLSFYFLSFLIAISCPLMSLRLARLHLVCDKLPFLCSNPSSFMHLHYFPYIDPFLSLLPLFLYLSPLPSSIPFLSSLLTMFLLPFLPSFPPGGPGSYLPLSSLLITPSVHIACPLFIQGSGWVRGSLATLSSTSSTPSRGRRQLPQTPPIPRPSVAYKTANSSPVQPASDPHSVSPGRLSRGLSEHRALRHSVSSYRHVPCPVTRISSEPFLGQGYGYEPLLGPGQGGYCHGYPRDASPCSSLQDGSSLSPGSQPPGPSPGAGPPDYAGPSSSPRYSRRGPNGYHFSFPSSGGPRAPRYYQEVEEDEWC